MIVYVLQDEYRNVIGIFDTRYKALQEIYNSISGEKVPETFEEFKNIYDEGQEEFSFYDDVNGYDEFLLEMRLVR